MAITIKGGRVIDPERKMDSTGDVVIDGKVIIDPTAALKDTEVIDATGLWVVPGLVDLHVHLREPGGEEKEDIKSGLEAAAAGGFTAVMPMPNTNPPNDRPEITTLMVDKAKSLGKTRLYPVAAVTEGRMGSKLAPLAELRDAGAVAFSDDGSAVVADQLMEQALAACLELGVPLAQHAEDPEISGGGVIHDGEVSRRLALPGWPTEAEERIVARDIELARRTGARLHICHVSSRRSVEMIRKAKAESIFVTAEATPHHLLLTDELAFSDLDPGLMKVNPPLRSADHVEALRAALADGTIDAVATDHAPHSESDKQGGIVDAAFGMIGLELALPLMLKLVEDGLLTPLRLVEVMSTNPARAFSIPGGTLAPGAIADLTLIDPARPHMIDPKKLKSKSRNTPFFGWKAPGCAVRTIVEGRTIYDSCIDN